MLEKYYFLFINLIFNLPYFELVGDSQIGSIAGAAKEQEKSSNTVHNSAFIVIVKSKNG